MEICPKNNIRICFLDLLLSPALALLTADLLPCPALRPGLDGWNAISYTMTLDQMLESIGEPVKNWRRK